MTIRNETPPSRPLAGRVAVVTGAARGIGRAAAVALSSAGADVAFDTALTRHEDRYAQVISEAGQVPSRDMATDERTAIGLLKARTPLGVPWIEPADVAPLVVFLASDQARMVSGTSFAATGGDSAHLTA